jgi:hypothetical protein
VIASPSPRPACRPAAHPGRLGQPPDHHLPRGGWRARQGGHSAPARPGHGLHRWPAPHHTQPPTPPAPSPHPPPAPPPAATCRCVSRSSWRCAAPTAGPGASSARCPRCGPGCCTTRVPRPSALRWWRTGARRSATTCGPRCRGRGCARPSGGPQSRSWRSRWAGGGGGGGGQSRGESGGGGEGAHQSPARLCCGLGQRATAPAAWASGRCAALRAAEGAPPCCPPAAVASPAQHTHI